MPHVTLAAWAACTLSAVALLGCAPAPGAASGSTVATASRSPSQCFRSDQVRNFRTEGQTKLYVRSIRDEVFEINTAGGCWDISSALSIAVAPTAGGLDRICPGDPVRIYVPNGAPGQQTCRAFVTKSLTEEEVAALPARARP